LFALTVPAADLDPRWASKSSTSRMLGETEIQSHSLADDVRREAVMFERDGFDHDRFTLNVGDVEELLAQLGSEVSREAVRCTGDQVRAADRRQPASSRQCQRN
jgi:hypothetical protein